MVEWHCLGTPDQQRGALAQLRRSILRAIVWGTGLSLTVLATITAIAPGARVPWLLALGASWTLPATFLALTLAPLQTRPTRVTLTSRGYRRDRRWRFEWKGSVGWAWLPGEPPELLLVGAGGIPVRLLGPPPSQTDEVANFLRAHGPQLTPAQVQSFTTPIESSLQEALWLFGIAYTTGLCAGAAGPLLLRGVHSGLANLAIVFLGSALPGWVAWRHLRKRYAPYRRPLLMLAATVWFLTSLLTMLFNAAFIVRLFYS